MKLVLAVGLVVVALFAGSCTADSDDQLPSPVLAKQYDVGLRTCHKRVHLTVPMEECEALRESSQSLVYAHALLGRAGGSNVFVRVKESGGPVIQDGPVQRIPPDRSFLYVLEVVRPPDCIRSCSLVFEVFVDDIKVEYQTFDFKAA